MGAFSTATTSPTRPARSATGPPSFPVHTSTSACCCASVALSSTTTATFQLPLSTFPGMCTSSASVRPVTSVPFTVPLSTWYAKTESHVGLSGSSPIQQGQSTLQVQTSRRVPSSWYAISQPPSERTGLRFHGGRASRLRDHGALFLSSPPPRVSDDT